MNRDNLTISLFFPAYHDEGNIQKVVETAVATMEAIKPYNYDITIIEDGSPDNTAAVADQLATRFPQVKVIHHQQNKGYGATLREGFTTAQHDYVFYSDGDNQFDLTELEKFINHIPKYDAVIGYRQKKQYAPFRMFTSGAYNFLIRHLFRLPYRDINCAFKLFRRDLFANFPITSKYGFIDAEIILAARRANYRIMELPVRHLPRLTGLAKGAQPSIILGTIAETFRYYFRQKKST